MIVKLDKIIQSYYLSIQQADEGGLPTWAIELGPLSKGQEREEGGFFKCSVKL